MKKLITVVASVSALVILAACSSTGSASTSRISGTCFPISSTQGFSTYDLVLMNTGSAPVTVSKVTINFSNRGQSVDALSVPAIFPGQALTIPMETTEIPGKWSCSLGSWRKSE